MKPHFYPGCYQPRPRPFAHPHRWRCSSLLELGTRIYSSLDGLLYQTQSKSVNSSVSPAAKDATMFDTFRPIQATMDILS